MMKAKNSLSVLALSLLLSCGSGLGVDVKPKDIQVSGEKAQVDEAIRVGAACMEDYLPGLQDKRIAVVANQTSMVGESHLVDTLLASGVHIEHVYAPEHGFRGDQDAGAHIHDETDQKTGLPIYSLHGKSKKPSAESIAAVDLVVFDIQDVGARFYTYISSLHFVMEACAEQGVPIIVLDRPNPHIASIDGPIMQDEHRSFVGKHPVPILYGLSIGEYAQMINGEGWLADGLEAELRVIPCENYSRDMAYDLPIAPSPNLPRKESIQLYPSLCLFEGTVVSVGRGTDRPFELLGHPAYAIGDYTFTPQPNSGSKYPKLEGELCKGVDFGPEESQTMMDTHQLDLGPLLDFYAELQLGQDFFRADGFFELLSGTAVLREQIMAGASESEIRDSWRADLLAYETMSKPYRIYK